MNELLLPDKEYFSIGDVAKIIQVPAYVLRYWESEFKILRPLRRSSGQRKYTRKDIELIYKIKDCLYNKKFTIAGAKKELILDKRKKEPEQLSFAGSDPGIDPKLFHDVKKELEDILKLLKQ